MCARFILTLAAASFVDALAEPKQRADASCASETSTVVEIEKVEENTELFELLQVAVSMDNPGGRHSLLSETRLDDPRKSTGDEKEKYDKLQEKETEDETAEDSSFQTLKSSAQVLVENEAQLIDTHLHHEHQPNYANLPTSCYGVWYRGDTARWDTAAMPWVKGAAGRPKWRDLEASPGQYDFSALNTALEKAAAVNGCMYARINVGPDSPDWIYNDTLHPVPRVVPECMSNPSTCRKPDKPYYPYYLHENYKYLFTRMLQNVEAYLRSHRYSAFVTFVQANFGCTGDAVLYKDPPPAGPYTITSAQEQEFMGWAWGRYYDVFNNATTALNGHQNMPIMVNGAHDSDRMLEIAMTAVPVGLAIKGGGLVRGHHLTGEAAFVNQFHRYLLNPRFPDRALFARSEMDQGWRMPMYLLNRPIGFYWGVLNGLNQGLSIFDVHFRALDSAEAMGFQDSFEFFIKYADQIWPRRSSRAFVALHEGLDANDVAKFPPEPRFVNRRGNLRSRFRVEHAESLCAQRARLGCRIDARPALTWGQSRQREMQAGYNDVGFGIWPTNYMRWLEQIDADSTSQGVFRIVEDEGIGGNIRANSSKYSRFARQLNHGSGMIGMYFKFHDEFFIEQPVASLVFTIVWFDLQAGSWQIQYDDNHGETRTGFAQLCAGDLRWKSVNFTISDAAMNHTFTRQSDFAIVSNSSTDVVLHLIEVSRA